MARTLVRDEPMHEICGAAEWPALHRSRTALSVRSRVEPPAPYVTEKNSGLSCASCFAVCASFSAPSGVFGGKNSKLKQRRCVFCDSNGPLTLTLSPSTGRGKDHDLQRSDRGGAHWRTERTRLPHPNSTRRGRLRREDPAWFPLCSYSATWPHPPDQ